MYTRVNVDRDVLHDVLREMAPVHLKGTLKRQWSTDNPTRNFCYVVTEWLVRYVDRTLVAYSVDVPGDDAKHYFARTLQGDLVDLTAEQFGSRTVPYENARHARFMPPSPSKRTRVLNELYEQRMARS